jgi:HJR/Mrr/RecB family endonuclease
MADIQISAFISEHTKEQLEKYADAHGVKKGHLVEVALQHHLHALRELPADVVIPPRITLTRQSFEQAAALVAKPRRPTKAMRDLMAGKPVRGEP